MTDIPQIVEFEEDIESAEAPEPLPLGDYRGEIVEAKVDAKANDDGSQNVFGRFTFRIGKDQFPADFAEVFKELDHTDVTYIRSLNPDQRSRFGLKKFAQALGVVVGKTFDPAAFVGQEGLLKITHRTYEGVNYAQVSAVNPVA